MALEFQGKTLLMMSHQMLKISWGKNMDYHLHFFFNKHDNSPFYIFQEDTFSTPLHITAVDCGIDAHERDMVSEISYSSRHTRIQYLRLLDYLFSTFPHLK